MFSCRKEQEPLRADCKNAKPAASPLPQSWLFEEEVLKLSGLELHKELHVFDVTINFQGEEHKVHTYKCGDQNSEILVLVHGYGGSSLLYYPMLKKLSEKYKVYCIDLLGMGLSSRPEFKCQSTQETIDFFVESIELWREALAIEEFCLGGHSFGGYMSVHYSCKYHDRVKKLFLLSPVGVTKSQEEVNIEEFKKKLPWLRRQIFGMVQGMWESKTTPAEYYRKHSIIGNFLLKQYMTRQFGKEGKEEKLAKMLIKYYTEILKLEGGSDRALYYVLRPPRMQAFEPAEDYIVENLKMPIVCYYGDRDWMDKTGSNRIFYSGSNNFKIEQVSDSGHQITMHNPEEMASHLVSEFPIEVSVGSF